MADTLSLISLISFIVAGACLGLAVIFWFAFGIPKVIGDLTGRTARKSIAGMRTRNETIGSKIFRRSDINAGQGGSAAAMSRPVLTQLQETEPLTGALTEEVETEVLGRQLIMLEEIVLIHTDEAIE